MIKDLIKDLSKFVFFRVFLSVGWLLAIILGTRVLTTDEYGQYSLVLSFINICAALSVGWIGTSVVRFLPKYIKSGELEPMYKSVNVMFLFSGLLVGVLMWVVVLFIPGLNSKENIGLFRLGVVAFLVLGYWNIYMQFLRSARLVITYGILNIWQNLGTFLFGVALVYYFDFGAEGMVWGIIIGIILILPVILLAQSQIKSRSRSSTPLIQERTPIYKEFLKYGLPVVLINVFSLGLSTIDRFILNIYRGASETGVYSASYMIAEQSIFVIISLFSLTSVPILFGLWEDGNKEKVKDFMSSMTRYYMLIGLPVLLILILYANEIVSVMVDKQFEEGFKILYWVSGAAFLVGISNIYSEILTMTKNTTLLMYGYLVALVVNVILNFILVPEYGYMACAFSTAISYCCLLLYNVLITKRYLSWSFPLKEFILLLAILIFVAGAAIMLKNIWVVNGIIDLVLIIVLVLLIYLTLTYFTMDVLRRNEKLWIKNKIRSLLINSEEG